MLISGFGTFTMDGGVIMGNTARSSGGGLHIESMGSFRKTGGVIYGSNAPAGLRNKAVDGHLVMRTTPITYGNAVCAALTDYVIYFRDNTVNDNLNYTGASQGNGIFGVGEKWDNSDKAFRRMVFYLIISALAVGIVFFFVIKAVSKKRLEAALDVAKSAPEIDLECFNLTDREKEVCKLLLTELEYNDIAAVIGIKKRTVIFHAGNLFRKFRIPSRTGLYDRLSGNN